MLTQIKNRWTGEVLFECECELETFGLRLGFAVKAALKSGKRLTDADLTRANLTRADLTDANLTKIRDDIWAVLSSSPSEVPGLRTALIEGRVDGSTYKGDCACLVGTIANIRQCNYESIPNLRPDAERAAERFFLAIRKGDTPETNQCSKLALEWVDQWLANVRTLIQTVA